MRGSSWGRGAKAGCVRLSPASGRRPVASENAGRARGDVERGARSVGGRGVVSEGKEGTCARLVLSSGVHRMANEIRGKRSFCLEGQSRRMKMKMVQCSISTKYASRIAK